LLLLLTTKIAFSLLKEKFDLLNFLLPLIGHLEKGLAQQWLPENFRSIT